ncbi:12862_t:CDS:2, partial [Acaulospora colombiana]
STPLAHFGTKWHGSSREQRAGVLIHELSHASLGTGDHWVKTGLGQGKFIGTGEANRRKDDGEDVRFGVGYASGDTNDIMRHGGAALGDDFKHHVKLATNPNRNADSWLALSALGKADTIVETDKNRARQEKAIRRKAAAKRKADIRYMKARLAKRACAASEGKAASRSSDTKAKGASREATSSTKATKSKTDNTTKD